MIVKICSVLCGSYLLFVLIFLPILIKWLREAPYDPGSDD